MRIADDGEIQLKGGHVFRGYRNQPGLTAEVFDHGWFRTGDLGTIDDEGYLKIVGRKKEIIVTAGGKNVAPAGLEDRLRTNVLVSQCVVVGDQRPFIGVLITLDEEGLGHWLAVQGKSSISVEQAATDADVLDELYRAVAEANAPVSRAESIRKLVVLPGDFSEDNGFLTPSLKVKRKVVLEAFAEQIDELYTDTR
ncbi:hypothetical protein [Paraoerskovia sediminicola]